MNIRAGIAKLLSRFAGTTKSVESWVHQTVLPQDPAVMPREGKYRAQALVNTYRGPIKRCVDLNAQNCAKQTIRLFKKGAPDTSKKDAIGKQVAVKHAKTIQSLRRSAKAVEVLGMGEVTEITEHPILEAIRKANPWQSGLEFRRQMFMYLWLAGDFGIHVTPGDDGSIWLLPMAPHWMEVVPNRETLVDHYRYGRREYVIGNIPAEEVVFLAPSTNPFDPYRGDSPVSGIFKENTLHENGVDSMTALMRNQLVPALIIALAPGATPDQAKAVQQKVNAEYAGVKNRGKAMVITSSTIQTPNISPREAELLPMMRHNEDQIAAALGVPQSFYRLSEMNLASSQVSERQYAQMTIEPMCCAVADILTEKLLPFFGLDPNTHCLAYVDIVPGDMEADLRVAAAFADLGETPNGALARVGLEGFEGGDVARERKPMSNPFGGYGNPAFGKPKEPTAPPAKSITIKSEEVPASALDKFPEVIDRVAEQMAVDLDAWYTDLYRTAKITKEGIEIPPGKLDELGAIVRNGVADVLGAGGQYALGSIGMDAFGFDVTSPATIEAIQGRVRALVVSVTGTVKEDVLQRLTTGIEAGESVAQVAAGIQQQAPALAKYQAVRIARTETVTGFNAGAFEAWKQAAIPFKVWDNAGDSCPTCTYMQETYGDSPIPFNDEFIGPDGVGYMFPAIHPNCRCGFLPVFADANGNPLKAITQAHMHKKGGCCGNHKPGD